MKKTMICIVSILLYIMMTMPLQAARTVPLLVDDADLLSDSEENEIEQQLDAVSEKYGMEVVIVTVWGLDGKSAMAYADDYYDYNGYLEDGILLLISMEDRDWWISTSGEGKRDFTDAGLDYIAEKIIPDLSNGDYDWAFTTYVQLCDEFIGQARNGQPYDVGNMPAEAFAWGTAALIAFVPAFIIALITVLIMKSKLKSVHKQDTASAYTRNESLHLTEQKDRFLYVHHSRTVKPKNNSGGSSTHRSSSGSSHGGSGGKF